MALWENTASFKMVPEIHCGAVGWTEIERGRLLK
jgi:hypothetical protein